MRYFAFHNSIGFVGIGGAKSIGLFQAFAATVLNDLDVTVVTAMLMVMFLPFAIAGPSWFDWRRMQNKRSSTMEG